MLSCDAITKSTGGTIKLFFLLYFHFPPTYFGLLSSVFICIQFEYSVFKDFISVFILFSCSYSLSFFLLSSIEVLCCTNVNIRWIKLQIDDDCELRQSKGLNYT
jgi:hypothetical protein